MCCRSLHKNTPALMNVHPTYMHFAPHKSFKQGQPGSFLQGFDLPETNLRETVGPRARHGYMVRMVKWELNSWNSRQFTRIQTTQLWSLTAGTSQAPNDLLPSSLAAMACGRSSQHPCCGVVNRAKTHHKRKKTSSHFRFSQQIRIEICGKKDFTCHSMQKAQPSRRNPACRHCPPFVIVTEKT